MKTTFARRLTRSVAAAIGLIALTACQHAAPPRGDRVAAATQAATPAGSTAGGAAMAQPAVNGAPVVTFHLAQLQPAEGLARVQPNPQVSLYAARQPVFTQADLRQVIPVQDSRGQVFLRFEFNQRGSEKLAQVTRAAIGNYLLLSIRGRLVAIPRIQTAHEDGSFPVPFDSVEEAQSVVRLLRQAAG